jgi:hypothetical protein
MVKVFLYTFIKSGIYCANKVNKVVSNFRRQKNPAPIGAGGVNGYAVSRESDKSLICVLAKRRKGTYS